MRKDLPEAEPVVTPPLPLRDCIDAVVIGASAGGVQALSVLLPALLPTVHVAVFVVLHLPRDKPSLLTAVFERKCAVPVREALDKEPVVPGTVYFAPSNYHLLLDEGPRLALSNDEPVHNSRPSIDVLFESAAEIYRQRLLGIILTGANEDGAEGLATVRRLGGTTMVQEPHTALSPQMVLAALKLCQPDHVVSLEQMASTLASLARCDG